MGVVAPPQLEALETAMVDRARTVLRVLTRQHLSVDLMRGTVAYGNSRHQQMSAAGGRPWDSRHRNEPLGWSTESRAPSPPDWKTTNDKAPRPPIIGGGTELPQSEQIVTPERDASKSARSNACPVLSRPV